MAEVRSSAEPSAARRGIYLNYRKVKAIGMGSNRTTYLRNLDQVERADGYGSR
jgi:hypothetical protein